MQAVTSGANPVAIKKGIDRTCTFLVQKLRENAQPVKGTDDIKVRRLALSAAAPHARRPNRQRWEAM